MTPELETCLNYCDHGEGTGPKGTGEPYLPTLHGLIVNAVNAEVAAKDFRIKELEQWVANLEEYMLKGVAFRDELQAEIKRLRKVVEAAIPFAGDGPRSFGDLVALRAVLKSTGEGEG